jgi:hypothetical protein
LVRALGAFIVNPQPFALLSLNYADREWQQTSSLMMYAYEHLDLLSHLFYCPDDPINPRTALSSNLFFASCQTSGYVVMGY